MIFNGDVYPERCWLLSPKRHQVHQSPSDRGCWGDGGNTASTPTRVHSLGCLQAARSAGGKPAPGEGEAAVQKEPSRPLGVLRLRQQGREALTGEAEDPGRERKAAGRGGMGGGSRKNALELGSRGPSSHESLALRAQEAAGRTEVRVECDPLGWKRWEGRREPLGARAASLAEAGGPEARGSAYLPCTPGPRGTPGCPSASAAA